MKNHLPALITSLCITGLVGILHALATRYGFYYIFWWYDTIQHILAGFAIGFFGLSIFSAKRFVYGYTLILAGFIGVLWEVFERVGHSWWPSYIGYGGMGDTVIDIVCGILGALIIIILKHSWQKNNITHI